LVLKDIEGIGIVYLDDKDIVRQPIKKKVLDAYKYTESRLK
jgi:phosphate starvation-inducible PhoH-like protein